MVPAENCSFAAASRASPRRGKDKLGEDAERDINEHTGGGGRSGCAADVARRARDDISPTWAAGKSVLIDSPIQRIHIRRKSGGRRGAGQQGTHATASANNGPR